jgi:hypothetical protein
MAQATAKAAIISRLNCSTRCRPYFSAAQPNVMAPRAVREAGRNQQANLARRDLPQADENRQDERDCQKSRCIEK